MVGVCVFLPAAERVRQVGNGQQVWHVWHVKHVRHVRQVRELRHRRQVGEVRHRGQVREVRHGRQVREVRRQVWQVCRDIVVQSMGPSHEQRHGNYLAAVLFDAGDHHGRVCPHPAFPPLA
jgi:hypothetical protein